LGSASRIRVRSGKMMVCQGFLGGLVLEKRCVCGKPMSIGLRTVIYSNKVKIENVPVYSCTSCERSEVLHDVKKDLSSMLKDLEGNSEKLEIQFQEENELAFLLHEATRKERAHIPVEKIVEERINQLLDMLILARSLGDDSWTRELRLRLSQIARGSIAT